MRRKTRGILPPGVHNDGWFSFERLPGTPETISDANAS
jgi:hypothetical protein